MHLACNWWFYSDIEVASQGHSMRIFVRKMVPMTSQDQDPLSTKSNSLGFVSYSQMKF